MRYEVGFLLPPSLLIFCVSSPFVISLSPGRTFSALFEMKRQECRVTEVEASAATVSLCHRYELSAPLSRRNARERRSAVGKRRRPPLHLTSTLSGTQIVSRSAESSAPFVAGTEISLCHPWERGPPVPSETPAKAACKLRYQPRVAAGFFGFTSATRGVFFSPDTTHLFISVKQFPSICYCSPPLSSKHPSETDNMKAAADTHSPGGRQIGG